MRTRTKAQFGLRYGDGEVEFPFKTEKAVQVEIDMIRHQITMGRVTANIYEPMTIVSRVKTISTTKWKKVPS